MIHTRCIRVTEQHHFNDATQLKSGEAGEYGVFISLDRTRLRQKPFEEAFFPREFTANDGSSQGQTLTLLYLPQKLAFPIQVYGIGEIVFAVIPFFP